DADAVAQRGRVVLIRVQHGDLLGGQVVLEWMLAGEDPVRDGEDAVTLDRRPAGKQITCFGGGFDAGVLRPRQDRVRRVVLRGGGHRGVFLSRVRTARECAAVWVGVQLWPG